MNETEADASRFAFWTVIALQMKCKSDYAVQPQLALGRRHRAAG